jgi:hypothetical protein
MMMRVAVVVGLAVPATAAARPTVTVGEEVPFSATQLADAIELRGAADIAVHVVRRGDDLVVDVGSASQTVAIAPSTSDEAARVVAMVVVALFVTPPSATTVEVGVAPAPPADAIAPAPFAPAPPSPSRWSARATLGLGRDDGGTWAWPLTGALAYRLAPSARIVASVTATQTTVPQRDTWVFPARLGIEGRSTAVGLELGALGQIQDSCDGSSPVALGGYATGRIYVPIEARTRAVIEASVYYMLDQDVGCYGEEYGGFVGGGIEWDL